MTFGRLRLLVAFPLALFTPMTTSQAQTKWSWNGTWTGLLNNRAPIAVTIADDKVVGYAIEGAPFAIEYSELTPTDVSFGDRDHYAVKITRTSETTASEVAHGRHGFGKAALTRK